MKVLGESSYIPKFIDLVKEPITKTHSIVFLYSITNRLWSILNVKKLTSSYSIRK